MDVEVGRYELEGAGMDGLDLFARVRRESHMCLSC